MRKAARILRLATALAQLTPRHFNRLVDGADNIANANLGGIGRQTVSALRATNTGHQTGTTQAANNCSRYDREMPSRAPISASETGRLASGAPEQRDAHRHNRVSALSRELHNPLFLLNKYENPCFFATSLAITRPSYWDIGIPTKLVKFNSPSLERRFGDKYYA